MASEHIDPAALPPGLAAAWGVVEPQGRRGPKPAHSVNEIVDAALRLADGEGLSAVSLPRVAEQIGVTTNALYRYVQSKDELVILLADRAWGEPPELPEAGWREAAALWAHRLFDRFGARPWLLDVPTTVPLTPHNAAWLNALLERIVSTGLGAHQLLTCAYLLDSHARYVADLRRRSPMPAALQGADDDGRGMRAVRSFLEDQLRGRQLNALADVVDDPTFLAREASLDGFEFGLQRILDGIAASIE